MNNELPINTIQSAVKDIQFEKEFLRINIKLIKGLKNELIKDIETIKEVFFKQSSGKFVSVKCTNLINLTAERKKKILRDLDSDIRLVKNIGDIICNDLNQLKSSMDQRLTSMNKNDFIMDVLTCKSYEIEYNFLRKMKELNRIKHDILNTHNPDIGESKLALCFLENEKDIKEYKLTFEEQQRKIRQKMLESQDKYNKSANVLEDCLDVMKNNFSKLISIMKKHKHHGCKPTLEDALELDRLQDMLTGCKQLQAVGYKHNSQNFTSSLVIGYRMFCTYIIRKCQASYSVCYNK